MPANTFETHREEVVAALIEAMEKGTAPWQKPWTGREEDRLPFNPTTDKEYKGGNSLWLQLHGAKMGYADPRWMTYKQAQEKGWQVRKGEKGTHIEKWEYYRDMKETDTDGKEQDVTVKLNRPRVYMATVFNASQIDGVPPIERDKPVVSFEWNPIEKADEILRNSGARIYNDQTDRAFYSLNRDEIHLPAKDQFKDAAAYYGTALHELGHWTGHPNRLDRKFGEFGGETYAREELRAELASYFLATRLGIPNDPSGNAAYLKNWIAALKNDTKELYTASRDAEAITNLVMSYQHEKAKQIEQEVPAMAAPNTPEIIAARALTSAELFNTDEKLAERGMQLMNLQTSYIRAQWASNDLWEKLAARIDAQPNDATHPLDKALGVVRNHAIKGTYNIETPQTLNAIATGIAMYAEVQAVEGVRPSARALEVAQAAIRALNMQAEVTDHQESLNQAWKSFAEAVHNNVPTPAPNQVLATELHNIAKLADRQTSRQGKDAPGISVWYTQKLDLTAASELHWRKTHGVDESDIHSAPLAVMGTSAEHELAARALWLARVQAHLSGKEATSLNDQWSKLATDIYQVVPEPPKDRVGGWLHKAKDLADRQTHPEEFETKVPIKTAWQWLSVGLNTAVTGSDKARALLAENQVRGAVQEIVPETREREDLASTLLSQTDSFRNMALAVKDGQAELTLGDKRDVELLMDTVYGAGYGSNLLRQYTATIQHTDGRVVKNLNNTFELEIEKHHKDDAPSFTLRPFPGKAGEAAKVLNDTVSSVNRQAQTELNRPAMPRPLPGQSRDIATSAIER